jgi:hypothetical protein
LRGQAGDETATTFDATGDLPAAHLVPHLIACNFVMMHTKRRSCMREYAALVLKESRADGAFLGRQPDALR